MPGPNRLVLFVEGEGDRAAVPTLVARLLKDLNVEDTLFLDGNPFQVGDVGNLSFDPEKKKPDKWINWLKAAAKSRRQLGAVLLLLDGDTAYRGKAFCAMHVGRELSLRAQTAGAGAKFSVACVFALQEYESWLLAGLDSLAGKTLSDGRLGVRKDAIAPPGNLETAPRDAKGMLSSFMDQGYKPTLDQKELTSLVDLDVIRQRGLRAFRRLENALAQMAKANRSGQHLISPE